MKQKAEDWPVYVICTYGFVTRHNNIINHIKNMYKYKYID